MNICLITSSFPSRPDDIAQAPFLIDFMEGLRKRGHRVFVFTQDRKGEKEEFLEGVRVQWFPWIKSKKPLVQLSPLSPLDLLRIVSVFLNGRRALFRFVRENRIEACLALWVLPAGYFANQAFRRTKIPYSLWSLGSDIYRYGKNPLLYPMMRRIIQEARAVFSDGFDLSKRIEERFGRSCFFLATTRSFKKMGPGQPGKQERLKKPGGLYRFLFVGRIEKVKGIDLLLQSMVYLKKEVPRVHLTVVGRGGIEEWAKNFIKQESLEENVSWMGNVPDETLASLYESSDCVVIPSRSESIPLVFSEALQFNKDLIVTDVGDMGTLGRQYGVAQVVPPEDIAALKESLKKKVELQAKGKKAEDGAKREELKRLFDIEASVDRFLADY